MRDDAPFAASTRKGRTSSQPGTPARRGFAEDPNLKGLLGFKTRA